MLKQKGEGREVGKLHSSGWGWARAENTCSRYYNNQNLESTFGEILWL